MRSAAVEKPPRGRHFHLAGVIMLLDVGGAATEEQGYMERGMQSAAGQTRQLTASSFAPGPGGETNGQAPPSDSTTAAVPRDLT